MPTNSVVLALYAMCLCASRYLFISMENSDNSSNNNDDDDSVGNR